jgi:hypothetical protein
MINRRHDFTTCKQARGELFKLWWETKLRKAKECALEKMSTKDWLELEFTWRGERHDAAEETSPGTEPIIETAGSHSETVASGG